MPGHWVHVGARRLIDGTAVDPRGPTRRPACECSLCSTDRFGLRRGRGLERWSPPLCPCGWMAQQRKRYGLLLWAIAGYMAIWTGFFIYHLLRYRSSGFRDHDWLARHDDSDPDGALFLELGSQATRQSESRS